MSAGPTNRNEQMRLNFERFDSKYPQVWDLFVKLAFERINNGRRHLSASQIVEKIRHDTNAGNSCAKRFKINNNFRAFYVRKWKQHFPEYAGFFRTRKQPSESKPACHLPELTPDFFDDEQS